MIQNFNFTQTFEKTSIQADYQFKNISLALKLDSLNKVYSFSHSGAAELSPYLDFIGDYILDLKIDDFKDCLAQTIFSIALEKEVKWSQWYANEALLIFQRLLDQLIGREFFSQCDPDKIICRCFPKDLSQVLKGHDQTKGVKTDFLKESLVGSGCGKCKTTLDNIWQELDQASDYFRGKTPLEMVDEVKNHLMDFKNYSAQDLDEVELRNIYFDSGHFVFEFSSNNEFNFDSLQTSLINYLSSHFGFEVALRFTFLP